MELEPVRPITLDDVEGHRWAFRPQSDMTPLECALCTQLFVKMVVQGHNGRGGLDWLTYVREQRLERHFVDVGGSTAPTQIEETAAATIEIIAAYDTAAGIKRGDRIRVLEGMPIIEPWVLATPDNVASIEAVLKSPTRAAG